MTITGEDLLIIKNIIFKHKLKQMKYVSNVAIVKEFPDVNPVLSIIERAN